jgi:hypothetical protein
MWFGLCLEMSEENKRRITQDSESRVFRLIENVNQEQRSFLRSDWREFKRHAVRLRVWNDDLRVGGNHEWFCRFVGKGNLGYS